MRPDRPRPSTRPGGGFAPLILAALLMHGIPPAAAGEARTGRQERPAAGETRTGRQERPAAGETRAGRQGRPAGDARPAAEERGERLRVRRERPAAGEARTGRQGRPAGAARPAAEERGERLRVWLLTAAPGDAVWEHYGHNALRVLDTRTGRDVAYNWGVFDFRQADFVARFLRGRMLYHMAPWPTDIMIEQYREAGREVVLQALDLTAAEKAELYDAAEENARPRNRDYIYQYFVDNCSTRVRDLLDRVLGGALRQAFAGRATGLSYRDHTRRITQAGAFVYTGTDLLLGAPADRPISAWDELFLPAALRDRIRSVRITRGGETRPLVMAEEVAAASARPPAPAAPPAWLGRYLALGLLLGGVLGTARTRTARASPGLRRSLAALAAGWSLAAGGVGTVLALLLATDHTFTWWNENLFLFNPLALGLAALLPLSNRSEAWRRRARGLAAAVAGLGLAGLLWQIAPASTHRNAAFFALALPPHLAVAWSLGGSRETPAARGAAARRDA